MFHIRIPNSRVVKSTVRATLKGRFIPASIAGLLPYFVYLVIASVAGVFSMLLTDRLVLVAVIFALFGIFVLSPVTLGAVRWFWRVTDECEEPPSEVFYYFTNLNLYKRAVKCVLFLLFKCLTAIFACLLPFILVSVISNSWIYQFLGTEVPLWVAGLAVVQAFLRFVGIIMGLAVISRYYLFPTIVVMDDNMILLEAIHISVMVSRCSVIAFVSLVFSLLGWVLLSFLAVPLIYTVPLFFAAYAVHSRYALVNYNQNLDYYNKQQYML
ncbi:MAG: hypothetical protein J6Q74_00035 [Clostridia bacterium]|nr:hypothetical protein [Clostridia bacterium]